MSGVRSLRSASALRPAAESANSSRPMSRHRHFLLSASALGLWLVVAISAGAHDVGLSTATVRLQSNKIETELAFSVRDVETLTDLDADHDGKVTSNEF